LPPSPTDDDVAVRTHQDVVGRSAVLLPEVERGLVEYKGLPVDRRAAEAATAAWAPTLFTNERQATPPAAGVDGSSPLEARVALFRSMFAGRDDVHALRWANSRTGKAGWGPAVRGGWANARRPNREYLPLTDDVIERHQAGEIHAGLYPLLAGDQCRLLACDFDGPGWARTPNWPA
jgi:hypothetical protein